MNPTLIQLQDEVAALQIKVCALEQLLVIEESIRAQYTEILCREAKKLIQERVGAQEVFDITTPSN